MKFASIKSSRVTPKLVTFDAGPNIVDLVSEKLRQHNHFRYHLASLGLDYRAGRLTITGKLPSFYLKQVLQTILLGTPGVRQLENRVDVVACRGLSSIPHSCNGSEEKGSVDNRSTE